MFTVFFRSHYNNDHYKKIETTKTTKTNDIKTIKKQQKTIRWEIKDHKKKMLIYVDKVMINRWEIKMKKRWKNKR